MRWPLPTALVAGAAFAAAFIVPLAQSQTAPDAGPAQVLMFSAANVSKGGNFYLYYTLSKRDVQIRKGDTFEYDLYIPHQSTQISGGADIDFTDGEPSLRDVGAPDQNGIRVHPEQVVDRAKDHWYHRVIKLDAAAGRHTARTTIAFEGDAPGPYVLFAGNIGIHHADGSWDWAYHGGPLPADAGVDGNVGYSRTVMMRVVERGDVGSGGDVDKVIAQQTKSFRRETGLTQFESDVDYVDKFAKNTPDSGQYAPYTASARQILDKVRSSPDMTDEAVEAQLQAGRQQLAHTHPLMRAYTGYLVGHSHIDFQWLWEWPESLDVCNRTFGTVANLMDEFPGFSFSQSSSALYKTTQQHYPKVFQRIKEKVAKGQWDIVGGRVCEGDTNMISEESHAQQFLLGQRYFRANFGKTATVGWEPDTFGHAWSMPEIEKMGGCDYYYFCRGGKGKPLFWWEGPDGTRILAFDEPASGSWYDGNLSNSVLNELFPWQEKTGTKDILWVYGVGDHGGGVTREDLNIAKDWMSNPYYPNVKFSTADKFFNTLAKRDLSKVPTVQDELNPVFDGCYTTHSDMKRLNRDAENASASAETLATVASMYGEPYPQQTLNDNWEGICFNHHHDTLPGSAIHESYVKSREQLSAIVASSRNICGDSLRLLATFMKRAPDAEYNVTVFNPLGWTHGGEARIPWPFQPADKKYAADSRDRRSTGLSSEQFQDQNWVAVAPDGTTVPVSVTRGLRPDNPTGEPMAVFTANGVPGFGYRVFGLRHAHPSERFTDSVTLAQNGDGGYLLENNLLRVVVNGRGLVTSLFDKRNNRETLAAGGAANRLEVWHETADGMSAWTLGKTDGHVNLDGPADVRIVDEGPGRATIRVDRDYDNSHMTQYVSLRAGSDQLDLPLWVDWQEVGENGGPLLRVACDVAGGGLKASYAIPYATIQRPANGQEGVGLKSADLSGPDGGLTLVNDCKSGHNADGNTLRLSLLRASYDPDKMADQREHYINTALLPHAGVYGSSQAKRGFEFNQNFITARVPPSSSGDLPLDKSFVTVTGDTVIAMTLKRAEENPKAMVVRMFEANGGPAHVGIVADTPIVATRWVNFVEDPLGGTTAGGAIQADLHKYEIRNAELFQTAPVVARPKPLGPRRTPFRPSSPTPLRRHGARG